MNNVELSHMRDWFATHLEPDLATQVADFAAKLAHVYGLAIAQWPDNTGENQLRITDVLRVFCQRNINQYIGRCGFHIACDDSTNPVSVLDQPPCALVELQDASGRLLKLELFKRRSSTKEAS